MILSAYGFWLPNDPRGSWSEIVRNPNLHEFGAATKVDTHRSVAGVAHDRLKRLAAKKALTYPPVVFDGHQALSVACGFRNYVEKSGATVWACAVMPDHAHLVIARHHYPIEQIGNLIKGEATKQLAADGRHPFQHMRKKDGTVPPAFARKWWVVFEWTEEDVMRAIRYVENNPVKAGLRPQKWSFAVPFPTRYHRG